VWGEGSKLSAACCGELRSRWIHSTQGKKIQEALAFNLPVDVICTSHGVVWRSNPVRIVQQYLKWSNAYREDRITLVYDTM
jgi:flavorubredoxin